MDCDAAKDTIALGKATATDNCTKVVTNIYKSDEIQAGIAPISLPFYVHGLQLTVVEI